MKYLLLIRIFSPTLILIFDLMCFSQTCNKLFKDINSQIYSELTSSNVNEFLNFSLNRINESLIKNSTFDSVSQVQKNVIIEIHTELNKSTVNESQISLDTLVVLIKSMLLANEPRFELKKQGEFLFPQTFNYLENNPFSKDIILADISKSKTTLQLILNYKNKFKVKLYNRIPTFREVINDILFKNCWPISFSKVSLELDGLYMSPSQILRHDLGHLVEFFVSLSTASNDELEFHNSTQSKFKILLLNNDINVNNKILDYLFQQIHENGQLITPHSIPSDLVTLINLVASS